MTALAGVWNMKGRQDAGAACRRVLAPQRIYGPHGDAVWDGGDVAIGRALFEILPEDAWDRGPAQGAGGRYHLVGDVRLDNRDELAPALGIAANEARSISDSAFLMRAWERWGEGVFGHLYGDYAFALWDAADRRLILARDPLGMRPLHYHLGRDFVAFASMPKGLHALPEVPQAPDELRAAELLALVPEMGPRSFFRGICRVESGHYLIVTRDGVTSHRHWDPTPKSIGTWRGEDAVEAVRAHFDDAVRARLRGARGEVGAHLSAGLDSAGVAATAARLLAPEGRVTAFTAVPRRGYDRPAPKGRLGDEGPLASATARLYPNITHVQVPTDPGTLTDGWDRSFFLLDRPLLNPCNQRWWNAINAEAAQRGIGVMLTGETGNMSLNYAGLERLPELFRRGSWWSLLREMRALVRERQMRWRGAIGTAIGPWIPDAVWTQIQRRRSGGLQLHRYSAVRADRARDLDLKKLAGMRGLDLDYRPRKDGFESRLWVIRRIDRGNFQKAALGGYGVDQRDPTADRRLIELCLSLPSALYMRDGQPAALGRKVLADRLPLEVLQERARGYQAADWHEGLAASKRELADDLSRLTELPLASDLLDLPRMRALIENLPEDGWERASAIQDYRMILMRGSAVGHFLRRASRSNI